MRIKKNIQWMICKYFMVVLYALFSITAIQAQVFDLADRLILHIPVDGDASDQSGNNIPTMVNGPILTTDRFGTPNSAYKFDGINDYINLNNNEPVITSSSFTILIWIKIDGPSYTENQDQSIFEQRDDDAIDISAKSTIYFDINDENMLRAGMRTYPSPDGQADFIENLVTDIYNWHHYVVRLDKQMHTDLFVDGVKKASGEISETGNYITSIDHVDLGIHKYSNAIKAALNGVIDDVYIYNRALDDCEIFYLYKGSLPVER